MLRVVLLFLSILFPCHAYIDREYKHEAFCHEHQKFANIEKELIDLIPSDNSCACSFVHCSACKNTWVEEFERKTGEGVIDLVDCVLFCDCKDARRTRYREDYDRDPDAWSPVRNPDFLTMSTWEGCKASAIYPGYLDCNLQRYAKYLDKHLRYIQSNPECSCYWPEKSDLAREANDVACEMFFRLFNNTCLKDVAGNPERQRQLGLMTRECLTAYGLTLQCTSHAFFYRDYENICKDIYKYSLNIDDYTCSNIIELRMRLDDILDALKPYFTDMYEECLQQHPSEFIDEAVEYLEYGNCSPNFFEKASFDPDKRRERRQQFRKSHCCQKNRSLAEVRKTSHKRSACSGHNAHVLKEGYQNFSARTKKNEASVPVEDPCKFWVDQGKSLSDLFLYEQAIESFSHAILLNPNNEDALIERAYAYFELGKISAALKDYESIKKLSITPPYTQNVIYFEVNELKFSAGLIAGICAGGARSTVEIVPNVISSLSGIGQGIWAFSCAPKDVSKEFVSSLCNAMRVLKENSMSEDIDLLLPEIRDLCFEWDLLSDFDKGYKYGKIIGKYTIDVFLLCPGSKGLQLQRMRQANTLLTLERCATSETEKLAILAERAKRAAATAEIINLSKGHILVRNTNTAFHIMQKKHSWHKVFDLTGDMEKDLKKLITLLEENNILNPKNCIRNQEYVFNGVKVVVSDYKVVVGEETVCCRFTAVPCDKEFFLNNAWVDTRG